MLDKENRVGAPRYGSDGLRNVETQAARVTRVMAEATFEATRDVFEFEWGGEEDAVLLVTAEALELRPPTVEWTEEAYRRRPLSVLLCGDAARTPGRTQC